MAAAQSAHPGDPFHGRPKTSSSALLLPPGGFTLYQGAIPAGLSSRVPAGLGAPGAAWGPRGDGWVPYGFHGEAVAEAVLCLRALQLLLLLPLPSPGPVRPAQAGFVTPAPPAAKKQAGSHGSWAAQREPRAGARAQGTGAAGRRAGPGGPRELAAHGTTARARGDGWL